VRDETAQLVGNELARPVGSGGSVGSGAPGSLRPGLILATVCVCQLMVILDASVVNVALPAMDAELGFSGGSLSWVVNAYTLVFGGLLLLGGRIADLFGHRRAILGGLVVFGLASALGGLAQTPGQLIAARAGQGLAAAVLAPVGLTIIMVTFAEGPARQRAVGLFSMVAAGGSALGVLLGGLLTELLNWRWVLFINLPIVVVALALALRTIRDQSRAEARVRLDLLGALLGTACVTLLVYGTIEAAENGWGTAATALSLALAVALGAAFLIWEQRTSAPLIRLGVLRNRSVAAACLIILFIGAATIAGFYFASLFLQNVMHYSPLQAGSAFLPFCLGIVVGSIASVRLVTRFGARALIVTGMLCGAGGMYLFSRMDASSGFLSGFLFPSILASAGIGAAMVATISLGTTGSADHEAGLVSGLLSASRQVGGGLGLAALSAVAVAAARTSSGATAEAVQADSYSSAFAVAALWVLASAVAAFLMVPPNRVATAPSASSERRRDSEC
jgi:EmrB/QacA subfamily drug resistance transporter